MRNNTICGSWIAQDGGCSLLIRSIEDGFSLMLCDNTRCYKTIIRQMTALAQGRRVVIVSEGPGGDITIGKDGLLRCGAYGISVVKKTCSVRRWIAKWNLQYGRQPKTMGRSKEILDLFESLIKTIRSMRGQYLLQTA